VHHAQHHETRGLVALLGAIGVVDALAGSTS
jgi:hypothetical protein